MKKNKKYYIRRTHRYLGLFIGLQFLMWTISGLYFSWTDLDEIHGDHLRNESYEPASFAGLKSPNELTHDLSISSIALREIADKPFYWLNDSILINAETGELKTEISSEEAKEIAKERLQPGLIVTEVEKISSVGPHHEYRGHPLPAYQISFNTADNVKAYVRAADGSFQTIRHRDWRWFDFLWMTHTMDYQGRDDFNTLILRIFSSLGLVTVFSGFLLWFITSKRIKRLRKQLRNH